MSKKSSKIQVEYEWNKFISRLFPKEAKLPPLQRVEMKRAFFGGFGQAIVIMKNKVDKLSEKEALEAIEGLYKE